MSFKIGFTAETENKEKRIIENTPVQKEAPIIKKSVVEVFFPDRHLTCSCMTIALLHTRLEPSKI